MLDFKTGCRFYNGLHLNVMEICMAGGGGLFTLFVGLSYGKGTEVF